MGQPLGQKPSLNRVTHVNDVAYKHGISEGATLKSHDAPQSVPNQMEDEGMRTTGRME